MFPNEFLQEKAATQIGVCNTVKAESFSCHVITSLVVMLQRRDIL